MMSVHHFSAAQSKIAGEVGDSQQGIVDLNDCRRRTDGGMGVRDEPGKGGGLPGKPSLSSSSILCVSGGCGERIQLGTERQILGCCCCCCCSCLAADCNLVILRNPHKKCGLNAHARYHHAGEMLDHHAAGRIKPPRPGPHGVK